jgi:hypothetical protein
LDGAAAPAKATVASSSMAHVGVQVSSLDANSTLLPTMNESYTLRCLESSCVIVAAEGVGALRGLETLAHLAHAGPLPLPLVIEDSPRYPYR